MSLDPEFSACKLGTEGLTTYSERSRDYLFVRGAAHETVLSSRTRINGKNNQTEQSGISAKTCRYISTNGTIKGVYSL